MFPHPARKISVMKKPPLYPFSLAAYPVLVLGAYNISQIAPGDILRPLLLSFLAAGVVFGSVRLFLHDWHRAALAAALVLLLFFSYGQVYAGAKLVGITFLRHRVLVAAWGVLLIVGLVYIIGWLKNPPNWTPWLNLISALMLVYPAIVISSSVVDQTLASRVAAVDVHAMASTAEETKPDIYYIILDSYARQDALLEDFGYDNTSFIKALEDRGFYVADCAQSNYALTTLSLPASLNYNYLEELEPKFTKKIKDEGFYIKHSAVRSFLESQGYRTIAFATGYQFSELRDAHIYQEPRFRSSAASPFEALLANTTLLRLATDFGYLDLEKVSDQEYFRQRTSAAFEGLKDVPRDEGPYFTLAHIILPHPPYVFGARGEKVYYGGTAAHGELGLAEQQHVQGYRDQVTFANQRTIESVDAILERSDIPPIIIIQGDHGAPGASASHRMRILNAYYAPKAAELFYPAITPVNSFRLILRAYFNQDFPPLEDRSYFSGFDDWVQLREIPPSCPGD
jgi:hypothetical protein